MLFDRRETADAASTNLRAAGYAVDLQEQDDGGVVVTASTDDAALGVTMTVQEVAARLGGEFLGRGGLERLI